MNRHDVVIIKDSHRGLLYEDGILKDVLPAGRHEFARPGTSWTARLVWGRSIPVSEVVMVDIRKADRTVMISDLLTADRATISASFSIQFRVFDPLAAAREVRNPADWILTEVQTAARRLLRGMTLDEITMGRDELGEEVLMSVTARALQHGLELSSVDLKDLTLPAEYRNSLNQAVFAKTLRHADLLERWSDFDAETDSGEFAAVASDGESTVPFPGPQDDRAADAMMSRRASVI